MEVKISAQKMELTDALRDYVQDRMERISKFEVRNLSGDVHLNVEKFRNHIHATIKGDGTYINSEADDSESMYKAIDLCVDKIEKQLRRTKTNKHSSKEKEKFLSELETP